MGKLESGVFPVNEIKITVEDDKKAFIPIANLETCSIAVETGVETWTAMENEGWQSALATAKSATVSFSGKRTIGDAGNDYIAGMLLKNGQEANTTIKMELPDGNVFSIPGVVSISDFVGGDSTAVAPLSFEIVSNGKPSYGKPTM